MFFAVPAVSLASAIIEFNTLDGGGFYWWCLVGHHGFLADVAILICTSVNCIVRHLF